MLRPIDGQQAAAEILTRRESVRAPDIKGAPIRSIDFEAGNAAGPVLVIQFEQPVFYQVGQGGDFQSLVVAISGKRPSSTCKPELPPGGLFNGWSTTVSRADGAPAEALSTRARARAKGSATEAQVRDAAALMDEGRAALKKEKFQDAIAVFTKVLKLPENPSTADAQEYLALARQRNGQTAEARAEYEDYLGRYPSGEGADRVRQRLAGIATANGDLGAKLRDGRTGTGRDDGPQTWTVSGSASQFYIRDDSFRTLRDPSLPLSVNEDLDSHRTHQNELLSSLDAIATWSGNGVKSKLRFSGTEEHGFDNDREILSVAALFFETSVRDWGFDARVGRQTRNTGGVLGRFDGAVLSYQIDPMIRVNAVGGSPVARRRDTPFEDEKAFYGASVDIGPFLGGFDMSLFAIEQRDRSLLDRRAVGAELRYTGVDKSMFATIDYDVHFADLNAAVLTGSWTLADKSTIFGAFDYRKAPYLSAWNALQGQSFPTLYEMLRFKTLAEVEQLAADRTARFTSGSLGFSRPLNETFQVSADVTVTNLEGTVASGGVDAVADTGTEYFYSAQMIGNTVFTAEDLFVAGFRFADLAQSNYYVLDFSARYPVMDGLKINPRLRLGYRTGDTTDLEEFSVLPSVLFNYYVTRDWSLELEAGAQWTDSTQNGIQETTTDLFFTVGYRYDFYADGQVASQARAAPYGIGSQRK
jgi:tetratricopeptide (TPR) repeat protein